MSENTSPYTQWRLLKINPNLEIAITNRVLNLVLSRCWKDYDNFSSKLSCHIIKTEPRSRNQLVNAIKSFQTHFYTLNKISIDNFIEIFPIQETLDLLSKYHEIEALTFANVFQETTTVSIGEGKKHSTSLAILPEDKIQEALVDSLREKNATNCRGRAKDTVLEVSDLEHFSVNVKGIPTTFSAIVKGYKSVSGKTITWENIAHQVIKAFNRTYPDHILLVLAKNPADSVTSELIQYAKSVGNQNLIVMCDPLELTRFLIARHLL